MIPIEESIYCERGRASVRHIEGCIVMITLKNKGCEIELILNIF
jgi:hypothetical protein